MLALAGAENAGQRFRGFRPLTAADRQDSSLLTPLAAGNALVRRRSSAPAAAAGDTVEILPLIP